MILKQRSHMMEDRLSLMATGKYSSQVPFTILAALLRYFYNAFHPMK